MKEEQVKNMLPEKLKKAPIGDYYIGTDFCDKSKELNLAIFNKTTNEFEHISKLTATDKDKAKKFAEAVAQYLNGTLIYEL